jgi:predicted nucleotidyltransferase component of viral defense system
VESGRPGKSVESSLGGNYLMLSLDDIYRESAATGFQAEPLEKVQRLLELLESLRSHPFLKERVVLKGGTALNLFVFKVPRLSVDIDLNYIGSKDREIMIGERPKIEQAVQAVCGRLGIQIKRSPDEHAGGKWRLTYMSVWGRSGTLELDMNFLLRTPLWPPVLMDSHPIGSMKATNVPVLDVHELAAGKLAALFDRSAPRDLFDTCRLLGDLALDTLRLRLAFVVYGGASRRDWRTISIADVCMNSRDAGQQLIPMLRSDLIPDHANIGPWSDNLVMECRTLLSGILSLKDKEIKFLTLLNDHGEIKPDLLTEDSDMQAIIRDHPGLLWKAQNVREYLRRKTHGSKASD